MNRRGRLPAKNPHRHEQLISGSSSEYRTMALKSGESGCYCGLSIEFWIAHPSRFPGAAPWARSGQTGKGCESQYA